jgi:hypothetical protein
MNCCASADFVFLENGLRVSEKNIQADGYTLQFFPYRAIQSVRYSYTREWLWLWVHRNLLSLLLSVRGNWKGEV